MQKIEELDTKKIRSLIVRLQKQDIREEINDRLENLPNLQASILNKQGNSFPQWVTNLPNLAALPAQTEAGVVARHIQWAAQARWIYSQHLEALFCPDGEEMPRWITILYKLGRYSVAAKVMLQLATQYPGLIYGMRVEAIPAPEQQKSSLGSDRNPLLTVIRRLTGGDHD